MIQRRVRARDGMILSMAHSIPSRVVSELVIDVLGNVVMIPMQSLCMKR